MRVNLTLTIAAALLASSVPAAAQNQVAAQDQQAKSKAANSQKPKTAVEKICKRLSTGKVCMTEQKWKEYAEML